MRSLKYRLSSSSFFYRIGFLFSSSFYIPAFVLPSVLLPLPHLAVHCSLIPQPSSYPIASLSLPFHKKVSLLSKSSILLDQPISFHSFSQPLCVDMPQLVLPSSMSLLPPTARIRYSRHCPFFIICTYLISQYTPAIAIYMGCLCLCRSSNVFVPYFASSPAANPLFSLTSTIVYTGASCSLSNGIGSSRDIFKCTYLSPTPKRSSQSSLFLVLFTFTTIFPHFLYIS